MSSVEPERVLLHYLILSKIGTQRLLAGGTFRLEDRERSGHPLKSYGAEMKAQYLCKEIPQQLNIRRTHSRSGTQSPRTPQTKSCATAYRCAQLSR